MAAMVQVAFTLALTWMKTYSIYKESARLRICSPISTLLMRDGMPVSLMFTRRLMMLTLVGTIHLL